MSSQKFTTSDRDNFLLQIPGFSSFSVNQVGFSGIKDGDEVYQSVDTVRNCEIEKRLGEYSIYIVNVMPEKLLVM